MDKEELYDKEIAPVLMEINRKCKENGMSFFSAVQLDDEIMGRTLYFQENASLSIKLADIAIQTAGNIDSLWMWVQKYARKHGHNSVFLHLEGIPEKSSGSFK
jgi:hypothetical protein